MAIKNIEIDFQILHTSDPTKLIICDISEWSHIKDKPAIVEITLPSGKLVTHSLVKNYTSSYNSSSLYLSDKNDLPLPDGIYKISIKGSPDTFFKTRSYIRTAKLQLDTGLLYLSQGLDIDEKVYEISSKIDFFIKSAEAAMRQDKKNEAVRYYKEAKRIFDDYEKCKDC